MAGLPSRVPPAVAARLASTGNAAAAAVLLLAGAEQAFAARQWRTAGADAAAVLVRYPHCGPAAALAAEAARRVRADPFALRAARLAAAGRWKAALTVVRQTLRIDPTYPGAATLLARIDAALARRRAATAAKAAAAKAAASRRQHLDDRHAAGPGGAQAGPQTAAAAMRGAALWSVYWQDVAVPAWPRAWRRREPGPASPGDPDAVQAAPRRGATASRRCRPRSPGAAHRPLPVDRAGQRHRHLRQRRQSPWSATPARSPSAPTEGRPGRSRRCPAALPVQAVAFSNASHGWAVGPTDQIDVTTDGGATWKSADGAGTSTRSRRNVGPARPRARPVLAAQRDRGRDPGARSHRPRAAGRTVVARRRPGGHSPRRPGRTACF